MYIEKIVNENWANLGRMCIPFVSDAQILREKVYRNYEVGNYYLNADDNSNKYTYLIGDNGVGKSSLLELVFDGNINRENGKVYPKNRFESNRILVSLSYNKPVNFTGNCLRRSFNPNSINTSDVLLRHLVNHFSYLNNLESILNVEFKNELKITYITKEKTPKGVHTKVRKQVQVEFLKNNQYDLIDFIDALYSKSKGGKIDNQEIAKILYDSFYYPPLKHNIDDGLCIESDLFKRFYEISLLYKKGQLLKRNIKMYTLENEDFLKIKESFGCFSIDKLSEFDANLILLLSDLGVINYNIFCKNNKQDHYFPIYLLSTGQQQIIKLFSILSLLPEKSRERIIFLYDEPENSLHPKWQLNFPNMVKTVVEDIYGIKNSHFIFATHSPLIVMRSASTKNSTVVKLYRENEDGNRLKGEIIDNVHRYNIAKLLLDEFDFSYYNKTEKTEIREFLRSQVGWNENEEDKNLLDEVKKSFDIRDSINKLYDEIFNK